jgi:hypothetical protein
MTYGYPDIQDLSI